MAPRNWEDMDIDPPTPEQEMEWADEEFDAILDMMDERYYDQIEGDE